MRNQDSANTCVRCQVRNIDDSFKTCFETSLSSHTNRDGKKTNIHFIYTTGIDIKGRLVATISVLSDWPRSVIYSDMVHVIIAIIVNIIHGTSSEFKIYKLYLHLFTIRIFESPHAICIIWIRGGIIRGENCTRIFVHSPNVNIIVIRVTTYPNGFV